MCLFGSNVRENNTRCDLFVGPFHCTIFEIMLPKLGKAEQPQNSFRDVGEDTKPCTECRRFNLNMSVLSPSEIREKVGSLPYKAD